MTMTVMVAISSPALPRRKKKNKKHPLPHCVAAYMVMMMFSWGSVNHTNRLITV